MTHEAVYHRNHPDYFYAVSDSGMRCRIRVKRGDCSRIALNYHDVFKDDYHGIKDVREIEMERVATDMYFDYYEGLVPVDGMISLAYYFILENHTETMYFGNYHFHPLRPDDAISMFEIPVLLKNEGIDIPEWAREAIVYEIFPERFADGNPALHPPKIRKWDAKVNYKEFIGGNIPGITGKLDYLKDLGINTIYLTPVFYSETTHKYDTYDYFRVDPHFGTNEDLANMVRESHNRGIRVILDAVFNHCGTEFFAFRDVVKKGEASLYKEWFDIKKFPVEVKNFPDYKTYAFLGKMPKLATWNPAVREYFYEVGRFWIRTADIDGWRLDVAPEVDRRFWRGFRDAVKSAKPDALIVGEVWYNASMWLEGDQFDTNMNYPFLGAMSGFFGLEKTPPSMLDIQLGQVRGWYRQEIFDNLWNLIGSHDTARFMHICGGDSAKMKAAVFFLMTYTGVPMILYGDEAGMNGDHEFCRLGMVWDESKRDADLYRHYKKAIALRSRLEPLRLGDTKTIIADDKRNLYGFSRMYNGNKLDIYINNGRVPQEIKLRADRVYDHWNEKEYRADNGEILVPIAPKEGVILSE